MFFCCLSVRQDLIWNWSVFSRRKRWCGCVLCVNDKNEGESRHDDNMFFFVIILSVILYSYILKGEQCSLLYFLLPFKLFLSFLLFILFKLLSSLLSRREKNYIYMTCDTWENFYVLKYFTLIKTKEFLCILL